MTAKPVLLLLSLAIIGGIVFSDYGIPPSIVIIPIVFPIAFAVVSVQLAGPKIAQYTGGLAALGIFDIVRWVTWGNKIGWNEAIADERLFGVGAATVLFHIVFFSLCFPLAAWAKRIFQQARSNADAD